jgi:large conductance mechanosensitive channel
VQGFKKFILRGNVVDLAVAVVVATAFTAVVKALVTDFITPLIGAFGGIPDFSSVFFTVNNSKFMIGDFINQLLAFLVIAAVVYFFVVLPVELLMERVRTEAAVTTKECRFCLSKVPLKATRCAFCTSELPEEALTPR